MSYGASNRVEEGSVCPLCGKGILVLEKHEDCYCHVSPPCDYCIEYGLECTECGERPHSETGEPEGAK